MDDSKPLPSMERHYSPAEIAAKMGLSRHTIYRLIRDEPGVIRIDGNGSNRTRTIYRVPESEWNRIHAKYAVKASNGPQKPKRRTF